MKKLVLVALSLFSTTQAFAECAYTLKCANAKKTVVFVHNGAEGSFPYSDDSALTIDGKSTMLRGNQYLDAEDETVAGDFAWSEISDVPGFSVYTLTPVRGDGGVAVSIVANQASRTPVIKKNGGITSESYRFKATLTLRSAAGCDASLNLPTKKVAVSCVNTTACD